MEVEITGRQMEITPALREYVNSKVSRAEKYVSRSFGAHVILEVDKLRHIVEIIMNVKGSQLTAREEGDEMYASIDGAMTKIEQQLRRYKDKLSHHKGGTSLAEEALHAEEEPAS
ncbi:MAG: ribosome-associated translation inhibitor RaiA [Nitrospirota bacterium]|nr:ribosome-associated translation inhibitor RaiA [Nitrospirota bacterium]